MIQTWDDWVKVTDEDAGALLHEGHSMSPAHWAEIIKGLGIDVEYVYHDDTLREIPGDVDEDWEDDGQA